MEKSNFSQSILITGANRGIGLGYVIHYLKHGCSIVAAARNPNTASDLLQLQKEYSENLLILKLDVGSETSIEGFAKQLEQQNITFSLAINNAGFSREEEFGNWSMKTFENHFRVNTIGPALISQAILPFLEENSKLVQISSGIGSLKWNLGPENDLDAYAASKCALHSITIRLAEKLKSKNIGVFLINPGWVKTDMGGKEAPCTVDEAIIDISRTVAQLKLEQTGSFLSEKGEIIPW